MKKLNITELAETLKNLALINPVSGIGMCTLRIDISHYYTNDAVSSSYTEFSVYHSEKIPWNIKENDPVKLLSKVQEIYIVETPIIIDKIEMEF